MSMVHLKSLIEKLYHKDIFLPNSIKNYINRTYRLFWTPHSKKSAETDRHGKIDVSKIGRMLYVELKDIIEVEENETADSIKKLVIRKPYDEERDVVLVIIPNILSGKAVVKTAWFNLKSDTHKTLRTTVYSSKL
jgi:hypothetical protein